MFQVGGVERLEQDRGASVERDPPQPGLAVVCVERGAVRRDNRVGQARRQILQGAGRGPVEADDVDPPVPAGHHQPAVARGLDGGHAVSGHGQLREPALGKLRGHQPAA